MKHFISLSTSLFTTEQYRRAAISRRPCKASQTSRNSCLLLGVAHILQAHPHCCFYFLSGAILITLGLREKSVVPLMLDLVQFIINSNL